ncbi:hypothetical protein RCL1_005389 [Eukaryota sp. TZLM3-RCL]
MDYSTLSLPERMALIAKERQKKHEEAVRKREEDELSSSKCSFRPQINKMSKTIERPMPLVDYFAQWLKDKDVRTKTVEPPPIKSSPQINERSVKLAEKWRTRDPSPPSPQEEYPFRPAINHVSATMQRDGSLPERMTQIAEERRAKLEEARYQKLLEEEALLKQSLSPDISLINKVRGCPIEEDLYQRERLAQEKRLNQVSQQVAEEQLYHTPRINERSRHIAVQRKLSGAPSIIEKPISPPRGPNPEEDPDLTFQPRVNPTSQRLDACNKPKNKSVPRTEYLYSKKAEIERNREVLANSLKEREVAGCTFSPRITKKAKEKTPQYKTESNLIERSYSWAKKREENIKHEKEKLLEEQLKECTFTPSRPSLDPPKTPSKGIKDHYGVDEFIQRQAKARQLRDEQDPDKLISTGQNWSGDVTKPKPFKFNHTKGRSSSIGSKSRSEMSAFVVVDSIDPMNDVNIAEWKARRKDKASRESLVAEQIDKPWRTGTSIQGDASPKTDFSSRRCTCCNSNSCINEPQEIDFNDYSNRHAGELEYYKRVQLARKKPEETKTTWSPEVTRPVEFKFNQRPMEGSIPSLAKPVSGLSEVTKLTNFDDLFE